MLDKVYIAESKIANAGRGVYARRDIRKGEVVEMCPTIDISTDDLVYLNETTLVTYLFYCGDDLEQAVIALGFGSIYNHSYQPNAIYEIKPQKGVMSLVALRDISKDEEITVSYKRSSKNKTPLWFE